MTTLAAKTSPDPVNDKLDLLLTLLTDLKETQDEILERLLELESDYNPGFSIEEA